MATEQETTPRQVAHERVERRSRPAPPRLSAPRAELAAYGLIWIGVAIFLWSRLSAVDHFYLDEWVYVHGAEYIWDNLPTGLIGGIPAWDRGPQRLYATLIAPIWGPLGASTAFTVSHLLNVLVLTSSVVPAALLARRVIDTPALRVLAVALGVAVPWLTIGAHLLAENLAFPVFLWTVYAIVRAADDPSLLRQALALAAIGAGALCRLNLAAMLGVLVTAVVAAEVLHRAQRRREPFGLWLRGALRREALVVAAAVIGAIAALVFLSSGSASLGRYGVIDLDLLRERLIGGQSTGVRRQMATYARSLVVGTLILPFVLGLAAGLAGGAGRLGRRMVVPSVAALTALVAVIVAVGVYTFEVAEERYVFFVMTPIAVLGVAALEHLDRLQRWLVAAGAITLWLLFSGVPMPGMTAGNFFAGPAGGTWTRVVDHRLKSLESDLLGWLLFAPTGWLLIAIGLAALVAWVSLTRRRPRLRAGVLAAALGVCIAWQLVVLWYASKQELYGTSNSPGGIAISNDRDADREKWIDATLPENVSAAALGGVTSAGVPTGWSESMTFWSKELDAVVALPWNGNPAPVPPGGSLAATALDADGLAAWQGAPPEWLVGQSDDPRVQFAGRVAGRARYRAFDARELTGAPRAVWTAQGMGADGSVSGAAPATLTLDRAQAQDVRSVTLALRAFDPAVPARWRIERDGRTVARGTAGGEASERSIAVPACTAGSCDPAAWTLSVRGDVVLMVDAARLER